MKKHTSIAVLAGAALVFGSIFASCSNDAETKEVKVDKTYASAVTFTVEDDAAGTGKLVTLSTETSGATIHYTMGGETPTSGSSTFSTAIPVTKDMVIKALAVKEGIENSPISVANISIKSNTVTVYKDTENAVGSEIKIDGKTYYVISNTLSSTKNASRAAAVDETEITDGETAEDVTGLVDTGDEDTDIAIEKFASDVYVRKFLAEVGITKYIQVWSPSENTKKANASSSNGMVEFYDKFPIYAADKTTKIAEFQQYFVARYLIESLHDRGVEGYEDDKYGSSGTNDDKNDAFNKISEADLRSLYEPSKFRIVTYPADISSKVGITKRYGYDENGEVALTKKNLEQTDINKDYQKVTTATKTKDANSYTYTFDTAGGYRYNLSYATDSDTKQFYTFQNTDDYESGNTKVKRRIHVYSKGDPVNSDFDSGNFQCDVDFKFGTSGEYDTNTPKITVEVKGNNAKTLKYSIESTALAGDGNWLDTVVTVKDANNQGVTITVDGIQKDSYTLKEAFEKILGDYITFSSGTKEVNGHTVPTRIYLKAPYSDGDSYPNASKSLNSDFIKVTLVPDESVTTGVVYKEINRTSSDDAENVPAFVNIYSANFKEIIAGTYTTSTPVYSASFFSEDLATAASGDYPNAKIGSAEADKVSEIAKISDITFAWGKNLAKIYEVNDATATTPTYAETATLTSDLDKTTIKSLSTGETVISNGARYKSENGKLAVEKNANDKWQYIKKDEDIAVLTFTVAAAQSGKKISLLSLSDNIYFNKTQYFYAVTEVIKDDKTVYTSSTDCSSEKVAGSTCTIKESASADKPLTVKISLRAQKNLVTAVQTDFDYRVVCAPITLTFKEVDSGVSN